MKTQVLSFTFLLISFAACRVECRYPDPKTKDCNCEDLGFTVVPTEDCPECEDALQWYGAHAFSTGANYIIKDSASYDSIFFGTQPFGEIDFSAHALLGMDRITPTMARDMKHISTWCVDEANKKYIFKALYSLDGQCKNKQKYLLHPSYWIITPDTLQPDWSIEFKDIQINPQ